MKGYSRALAWLIVATSLISSLASPLYFEDFSGSAWKSSFVRSTDDKYTGELIAEVPEGLTTAALKVPEKAKFYGYAANVGQPIDPTKGLVLQFELKLADSLTCGGAYLKFLTASAEFDAAGLKEETPYVVMFGPDKCGATNKVHLIIKHSSPSGEVEEKHLKMPPQVLLDSDTHVYTAVLKPDDNTYEVLIDGEVKKSGSLFEDFEPSFNPPEEIDDPESTKPEDWIDLEKIPDPEAVKPDDWDEDAPRKIDDADAQKPEGWLDDEATEIDDPEAEKPVDWDDEEDGDWEAPKIPNPACTSGPGCGEWKRPKIPNPDYKGKWTAPFIDNPEYKGPWAPARIANPNYFVDNTPLANIGKVGGVALEIWTMDENYYFSNILIDNDPAVAEQYRSSHWEPKKEVEAAANEVKKAEEAAKAEAELKEGGAGQGIVVTLIRDLVNKLFDLPVVSVLRGPLEPLLDFVEDSQAAAVVAGAMFLAIPVFTLLQLIPKGKKSVAEAKKTREAKKEDKTSADDKPKATATSTSEIVEEEEDDEDAKKNVRRRVRRDA